MQKDLKFHTCAIPLARRG